jgi:hypothetical protein
VCFLIGYKKKLMFHLIYEFFFECCCDCWCGHRKYHDQYIESKIEHHRAKGDMESLEHEKNVKKSHVDLSKWWLLIVFGVFSLSMLILYACTRSIGVGIIATAALITFGIYGIIASHQIYTALKRKREKEVDASADATLLFHSTVPKVSSSGFIPKKPKPIVTSVKDKHK